MEDFWMAEYERIAEDFDAGRADEEELRARLKRLGFDEAEIDEHLSVLTA